MTVAPRYLLDTNVISEPAKPAPNRGFLRRFEQHLTRSAIASVTWHEALYGVEVLPEGKRRRAILEYLKSLALPVLPYDQHAAAWLAKERARLKRTGRSIPHADGQIAAIAVVHDLSLVTAKGKDFAGIEDLAVVDWMS